MQIVSAAGDNLHESPKHFFWKKKKKKIGKILKYHLLKFLPSMLSLKKTDYKFVCLIAGFALTVILNMIHNVIKGSLWHVRTAKAQIRLRMRSLIWAFAVRRFVLQIPLIL